MCISQMAGRVCAAMVVMALVVVMIVVTMLAMAGDGVFFYGTRAPESLAAFSSEPISDEEGIHAKLSAVVPGRSKDGGH